jgi:hypothetical protein
MRRPGSTRRLAILALLLLVPAASSFAGIGKGNSEIGFDFGYTKFDPDVADVGGFRSAIRGGYHFSSLFELEGQVSVAINWHVNQALHRIFIDHQLNTLMANGVFNFHPGKGNVVPYVLGGFGNARLSFYSDEFRDSGAAWQVAGGCRFFFGDEDQVAFRLEYARLSSRLFDTSGIYQSLTAGFTWRLGKG